MNPRSEIGRFGLIVRIGGEQPIPQPPFVGVSLLRPVRPTLPPSLPFTHTFSRSRALSRPPPPPPPPPPLPSSAAFIPLGLAPSLPRANPGVPDRAPTLSLQVQIFSSLLFYSRD